MKPCLHLPAGRRTVLYDEGHVPEDVGPEPAKSFLPNGQFLAVADRLTGIPAHAVELADSLHQRGLRI
jgi:hypothetical protein